MDYRNWLSVGREGVDPVPLEKKLEITSEGGELLFARGAVKQGLEPSGKKSVGTLPGQGPARIRVRPLKDASHNTRQMTAGRPLNTF